MAQTSRHTDGHGDYMTESADSVKTPEFDAGGEAKQPFIFFIL